MSRRRDRRAFMGEINVTPFVDVMLVLLIIFMVTTTVRNQGMDINLPRTNMVEALPVGKDHFVLNMLSDGEMYLDQMIVTKESLKDHFAQQVVKLKKKLYVRADKDVPHGEVVYVIGEARRAGIANVALVAEPEEEDTGSGTDAAPSTGGAEQ